MAKQPSRRIIKSNERRIGSKSFNGKKGLSNDDIVDIANDIATERFQNGDIKASIKVMDTASQMLPHGSKGSKKLQTMSLLQEKAKQHANETANKYGWHSGTNRKNNNTKSKAKSKTKDSKPIELSSDDSDDVNIVKAPIYHGSNYHGNSNNATGNGNNNSNNNHRV